MGIRADLLLVRRLQEPSAKGCRTATSALASGRLCRRPRQNAASQAAVLYAGRSKLESSVPTHCSCHPSPNASENGGPNLGLRLDISGASTEFESSSNQLKTSSNPSTYSCKREGIFLSSEVPRKLLYAPNDQRH